MGFFLKKIVSAFILPCGIFVTISFIIAFYFYIKREKKEFLLFFISGLFIWFLSSPALSNYLVNDLEKAFVESDLSGDVIVVLGGNSIEKNGKYFLDQDSMARVAMAANIHRKLKKDIILSGGKVYSSASFAYAAKDFLIDNGVNPDKIILEDKSKDTMENAFYVKQICDERKYKKPLIVTNASHMKRAIYAFRLNGIESPGYAAASFSAGQGMDFLSLLPGSGIGLRTWLHENIGILSYEFFSIMFEKEKK